MSLPRLVLSIDRTILSQASADCLVLSREVNKTFSTAFATSQLTAVLPKDRQLLSRNVFTWEDEFQITAWRPYGEGPLVTTLCNPVEITYKQTTRFIDSVLQPAKLLGTQRWNNPPERTMAIEQLGFHFRFRLSQRARPGGAFHPLFSSQFTPSLQGTTEIFIGNKIALFWFSTRVEAGDAVALPEDKSQVYIATLVDDAPHHVRYGYLSADKPTQNESPSWYPEPFPDTLLPIQSTPLSSPKL